MTAGVRSTRSSMSALTAPPDPQSWGGLLEVRAAHVAPPGLAVRAPDGHRHLDRLRGEVAPAVAEHGIGRQHVIALIVWMGAAPGRVENGRYALAG
jgi:hypothetical protein